MYQGIDSLFMNKLQIVVFLKKEREKRKCSLLEAKSVLSRAQRIKH